MTWLVGVLARVVLALAAMALLTFAALFVVGAWLTTWPLLRKSPRQRHLAAAMQLATALAAAAAVFGPKAAARFADAAADLGEPDE